MYLTLKLPLFTFYILNTIISLLIIYIFNKLINNKNNAYYSLFILALFILFPYQGMSTAGFFATIFNYMFPALFFLLSLFPIKNYLSNVSFPKWHIPFYCLWIILACNNEQICAMLFIFYIILFIYMVINKNINYIYFLFFAFIIFSLAYILFCPGNSNRFNSEINNWYSEFASFNLIQKIINCCGTCLYFFILKFNQSTFLIIFLLLTAIYICFIYKNIFIKISSFIPSILLLILIFNRNSIYNYFNDTIIKESITAFNFKAFLIFLAFILFFIIVSYNLILVLIKEYKDISIWSIIFTFYIGLISIFMIGFSPTSFASDTRTLTFFQFSNMIISTIMLIKIDNLNKYIKKPVIFILSFLSLFLYFLTTILFL